MQIRKPGLIKEKDALKISQNEAINLKFLFHKWIEKVTGHAYYT